MVETDDEAMGLEILTLKDEKICSFVNKLRR